MDCQSRNLNTLGQYCNRVLWYLTGHPYGEAFFARSMGAPPFTAENPALAIAEKADRQWSPVHQHLRRHFARAQVAAGTLKHFKAKDFPPSHVADFCTATNVKAELLIPDGYGPSSNKNNVSVVVLVTYRVCTICEEDLQAQIVRQPVGRTQRGV